MRIQFMHVVLYFQMVHLVPYFCVWMFKLPSLIGDRGHAASIGGEQSGGLPGISKIFSYVDLLVTYDLCQLYSW